MAPEPDHRLPALAIAVVDGPGMHQLSEDLEVALLGRTEIDPIPRLVERAVVLPPQVRIAHHDPETRGLLAKQAQAERHDLRRWVLTAGSQSDPNQLASLRMAKPERSGEMAVRSDAEKNNAAKPAAFPNPDAD
ncbi:MAG: hypothetical protein K0U98_05880 [Deltaproteobacteria bacterium]|nr:hypothetical protein [Deltaproteobacteria bacterium]